MLPKKVLLVTPGIKNSRGHEIHGFAIEHALKRYTHVEMLQLKKLDTSLFGKFVIWPGIEFVKQLIVWLSFLKFDEVARGRTEGEKVTGYRAALSTRLIGQGLVRYLKKQKNYQDLTLVSSHYAAIAAAKSVGLKNIVLIGPDFYPHPETAIPNTFITSPDEVFTKELIKFGATNDRIKEIGTILSPLAHKNAKKYKELRVKVAEGKQNPMHILITMGGAGPETKEVIQAVEKLKELVLTGHQLCSITVIVGDDRIVRRNLRKKLLKILNNQILMQAEGCGFRVIGGEKGFDKRAEVRKTWEFLSSSKEVNGLHPVDLVFTRPNDISLISNAMGIPTILFKPVGSHEIKGMEYLTKKLKSSVTFSEWLSLKQKGQIIDLGKNIEGLRKLDEIKSDSGTELKKVIEEAIDAETV